MGSERFGAGTQGGGTDRGLVNVDQVVTITSIRSRANDPSRCAVRAGGGVLAVVEQHLVDELGLGTGSELTLELVERLERAGHEGKVRREIVRRCSGRLRSRSEVVTMAQRRGLEREVGERISGELERLGIVDDAACAEAVIYSVSRTKPAGRRLLEQKLRQRGITGEIARDAIERALEGHDQAGDALALAQKKAGTLPSGLDPQARTRRVMGSLMRRGFDVETAHEAVRKALGDDPVTVHDE